MAFFNIEQDAKRPLSLRQLVRCAVYAWRHPLRTFLELPSEPLLPYGRVIGLLLVGSLLGVVLHYRVVGAQWLFTLPTLGMCYALGCALLAPVMLWGMTSAGLYLFANTCRRPRRVAWCDAVAFCFWFAWVASLLADLAHLVPGVHLRLVATAWDGRVQFAMHAGWFVVFPLLFLQLIGCWRAITGRSWRWLPAGALFALGSLAIVRLGIEPLPELLTSWYARRGVGMDFFRAGLYVVIGCGVLVAVVRVWMITREQRLLGQPETPAVVRR